MFQFAVIADLHLPHVPDSVQHDALQFAIRSIKKSHAKALICLGDVTAFGEADAARCFQREISALEIPVLCTMGNADIRSGKADEIAGILHIQNELTVSEVRFIAIDTSAEEVSKEEEADRLFAEMIAEIGKEEVHFQACYDHGLAIHSLRGIFSQRTRAAGPDIY